MRKRYGVILVCVIIIALMPLACFAGMSISQNDYINKYNQSIAGYGFEDQATIISPLNDTYTYYLAKNKSILSRSRDEESYSFAICIDETTDKVVAVQVLFDEEFLLATSTEEKQLISSICKAMIDGFCEVSKDKQEAIIRKVLLNNGDLSRDVQFYDTGFVFQSGNEGNSPVRSATSFSITVVGQDDFNNGLYWTPRNSLEYFIQAGDIAMAEQEYDAAVMYYEQTRGVWDKLAQAYRSKADILLAQGDIEGANKVLEYGGLDETVPYSGIVNGTWEAVFWYDYASNQNHNNIDFNKTIPRVYLQTAKSFGYNVLINITDKTIETLNSIGRKSSKEYSWLQNNIMVVYTEDGEEQDYYVIDENTIHLGGGDGVLVFARSDRDWNIESETLPSSENIRDEQKSNINVLTNGKVQVELIKNGWKQNDTRTYYHPTIYLKITNITSQSISKLVVRAAFNNDEEKEFWDEHSEQLIYPNTAPLKGGYSKSTNISSSWGWKNFYLEHLLPDITADIYINDEYLGTFTIEKKLY